MNNKPPILKNKQDSEKIPEFTLQKQYIDLMKTGQKTVEGRINSGGFADISCQNDTQTTIQVFAVDITCE